MRDCWPPDSTRSSTIPSIIDVVAHPGVEKSAVEGPRFVDRVQCDGNMPEAIEQAVEAIAKNLRAPTFVGGRSPYR